MNLTAGLLLPFANSVGALAGLAVSIVVNCTLGFGAFLVGSRAQPIGHVVVNNVTQMCAMIRDSSSSLSESSLILSNETTWQQNGGGGGDGYFGQPFQLADSYNRVVDSDGLVRCSRMGT